MMQSSIYGLHRYMHLERPDARRLRQLDGRAGRTMLKANPPRVSLNTHPPLINPIILCPVLKSRCYTYADDD